jgi:SAM-dependent methyltransferase
MPAAANLYDYPRYYDLVFGSDWKAEFDFLQGAFRRFVIGRTKSLFEPACGTGRLVYRLAKAGFDVSGLDLNPRAVAYCNRRLTKHGLPETAFVGDMADFALTHPVDAAFNTINSFRHLPTEAAARSHLECMAAAIRPGGIYVLGLHLSPTEGNPLTEESWSARRGHLCINTHLQTFEVEGRMERCRMTLDVYSPTEQFQIVDELHFRTYTLPQLRGLLKGVPEFELVEAFDFSYSLERPAFLDAATQDVVLILQRR